MHNWSDHFFYPWILCKNRCLNHPENRPHLQVINTAQSFDILGWRDSNNAANNDLNGWHWRTVVRTPMHSDDTASTMVELSWRPRDKTPNMLLSVYNTWLYPGTVMPSPTCQPRLTPTRVDQTKDPGPSQLHFFYTKMQFIFVHGERHLFIFPSKTD